MNNHIFSLLWGDSRNSNNKNTNNRNSNNRNSNNRHTDAPCRSMNSLNRTASESASTTSRNQVNFLSEESEESLRRQIVPYRASVGFSAANFLGETSDDGSEIPIFSNRRPRDFGDGLSSGLVNIAKGIGIGAAAVVAGPTVGALQGGLCGFFKGLGVGILMAVTLPIAGVALGISQTLRGALNTPEAVMERLAGKKWNKKKREWKVVWYSLEEERREVAALDVKYSVLKTALKEAKAAAAAAAESRPPSTRSDRRRGVSDADVADREYYDILNVEPSASAAEIRKSYYKLARDCHPDKNPDDSTAQQKFQALGEAYQILGDEQRRSDYDVHGKSAARNVPIIDSSLFFTMLFGSEALEPFVGKLKLTMFIESLETKSDSLSGKLTRSIMEFEQRKREVELAVKLRDRLQMYCSSHESSSSSHESSSSSQQQRRNEWCEQMSMKARDICQHSFGATLVEAVGWTYENYGCQFLGKLDTFLGFSGRVSKFKAKSRTMVHVVEAAVVASVAAIKSAKAKKERQKAARLRKERFKQNREANDEDNSINKNTDVSNPVAASTASTTTADSDATAAAAMVDQGFDDEHQSSSSSNDDGDATSSQTKAEQNKAAATATATQNDREVGQEWSQPTEEEKKANLENERQFKQTLPLVLNTVLSVCLIDLESTVRSAARKVLKDLAAEIGFRRQLAEGLIELGRIFQKEAEKFRLEQRGASVDYKRCLEEAFVRVVQETDRQRSASTK